MKFDTLYLFPILFFGGIVIIMTYGFISADIQDQCLVIAKNTTMSFNNCYRDNIPFPLNIDTSNWHIWKVNRP